MADLVKVTAWVTEAEAELIRAAAVAENRSVSNFAKIVLLAAVAQKAAA